VNSAALGIMRQAKSCGQSQYRVEKAYRGANVLAL
jgi:hypothetical protein